MDLSLLLLSQGIEPVIDPPMPEAHWGLLIPADQLQAARQAVDLYHAENRRRPWRQEIASSGVLFDWGCLAWVALAGVFFWISAEHPGVREAGAMRSEAVVRGQWELLFTAVWLHADLGHLAMNAVLGLVLLGLAMGRLGSGLGLLAACLCGAGGNVLATALAQGPHHSLGASGLVMGCLGLLAPQPVMMSARQAGNARSLKSWKPVLVALAAGVMLFVLLGLSPGTDVLAHLGGFLTGIVLGTMLTRFPGLGHQPLASFLGGVAFLSLTLWPWFRVLART